MITKAGLLTTERGNNEEGMVPAFSGWRGVVVSTNNILDLADNNKGDEPVRWLKGMEEELWGIQGHNFWQKFKMVCRNLCMFAPEFKQELGASSIAKTFMQTLHSVILRDVVDSFKEKRKRGDDGYNPYDKKYFYTWKYNAIYEAISVNFTQNPTDTLLAKDLQLLKDEFIRSLEQAINSWEQAESLEYMARIHSNIPNGLFTSEDTKEIVHFEFQIFNWLIYALQKMSDTEQRQYLQSLPFFPSNWPFTVDQIGLEKLRDEVATAWARLILSNLKISPHTSVYTVSSQINSAISRLWVDLEGVWLEVFQLKKGFWRMIGKWEVVWYELKKCKSSPT